LKKYLFESEPYEYEIREGETNFRDIRISPGSSWVGIGGWYTQCKINLKICHEEAKCTDCSVYTERLSEQKSGKFKE
jgi:hypothetical protein